MGLEVGDFEDLKKVEALEIKSEGEGEGEGDYNPRCIILNITQGFAFLCTFHLSETSAFIFDSLSSMSLQYPATRNAPSDPSEVLIASFRAR